MYFMQAVQPSESSLGTGNSIHKAYTASSVLGHQVPGGPLGKHKIKVLVTPTSPTLAGDPGSTASFSHLLSHL